MQLLADTLSRGRSRAGLLRLLAFLAATMPVVCALRGADSNRAATVVSLRLRVEWSAHEPAIWNGRLRVDSGRFESPESLSDTAGDAGTLGVDGPSVSIARRSPRAGDGFDVLLTARADALLTLELDDALGTGPPLHTRLALAECLTKPRSLGGESRTPLVVIRRTPGDALAVSFERRHLVFDPEEDFRMNVALNLLEPHDAAQHSAKATLKWKVVPAGQNRAISEGASSLTAVINAARPATTAIVVQVPREEGAYNLKLSAIGRGFSDVERIVQFVVIDPAPPSAAAIAQEPKLVDSFEPGGALLRKVPIVDPRPKGEKSLSRLFKFKRAREEPTQGSDIVAGTSWAYRMHVSRPGNAHLLELQLTAAAHDGLTFSLLQPDGQGKLVPAGMEVVVPAVLDEHSAAHSGTSPGTRVYRQIFWPQDRDCGVCVATENSGAAVPLGRVQVYDLGEQLPSGERAKRPLADPLEPSGSSGRRWTGQYLHKPVLARNLFGPQTYEAAAHRQLDDWRTFLIAGRRLAEYLRYQDQGALMLAVLADGATIYPSELAEPSVRYDSGRLFSTGQDPVQKDVLEMLLRLFDRAGLVLVPEMQFDAPLTALERLLREHPDSAGDLRLVDANGRTSAVSAGAPAPYNPLSPRVQGAVLELVRELLDRYASHPSFGGAAFELSPESLLQLPGIEWGYDAETIRRFEQATRIHVPRGSSAEEAREAYRFLTTTARRDWLRFRCAEIARFHLRLAQLVSAARPGARVIFSGRLAPGEDGDSESAAIEVVRSGRSPVQLLGAQGLDFTQPPYATESRITVLRPVVENPHADRLAQAALATLNHSPAIDSLYRSETRGTLLFWEGASGRTVQSSGERFPAPGDAAAQHSAHALAALDARVIFEGGDAIELVPRDGGLELIRSIASLPDVPFHPAGPQVQPVVVRAARIGNATCIYAVNDSGLPLTLELVLGRCPATTFCRSLASGTRLALTSAADSTGSALRIRLDAYGILECCLDRPDVAVSDARVSFSEEPLAQVKERIERLGVRMNAATEMARASAKRFRNPGFEEPGSGNNPLPGWELAVHNADWSLDADNPRSGRKSLQLSGGKGQARLASPELPLDGSPFVAVSVWLRSNKNAARAEIALEARIDDEPFGRSQIVTVGKSWSQHRFRVEDFPPGQIREARILVRPVDSCKLWIDDAELDGQSLSADELRQLTKTLSSAKLAYEEGRYADCERLLDGYWGRLLISDPVSPAGRPAARLSERKGLFRR